MRESQHSLLRGDCIGVIWICSCKPRSFDHGSYEQQLISWIVGPYLDGHGVLYREYVKSPAIVIIWDPCPLPVILIVAHLCQCL